jgi:hypothetical protein
MRSTDFSKAPPQGRAQAMLVVDSETADAGWARVLLRTARRDPARLWDHGYRVAGHRGMLIGFTNRDSMLAFAATVTDARTRGYRAESSGYSNGVWRAEGPTMTHIPTFTPVTRERERGVTPPEVAGGRALGPGRQGRRPRGHVNPPRSPIEGGSLFLGATRYRGPRSLLVLARTWYPMLAKMRRMKGYVWHAVYGSGPWALGTIAFFDDRDALLAFARMPEHRYLMQWIVEGTSWATAGFIRLLVAEDSADADTAWEHP